MRRIKFLVICFSICFVFSGLPKALSDDNPVISHARAGLGLRPHAEAWSEVTVRVSNPGDSKEVEVVVLGQGPKIGAERVLCRRLLYLPAESKREEKFYAPFGQIPHLEVQLYHKEIRIDKDTFPVKVIEAESPVFLIIDEGSGAYSFLTKLEVAGFSDSPVPVYVQPRNLSEKWMSYDGIDVVILRSFCQEDVSGHQVEALKQWVAGGGTLIITSGEHYNQYRSSFVEEMLDMRVLGMRKVTGLPSMVKRFGSGLKIDKDLYLTEVYPGSSKVILKEKEVPLILTSNYGSGKVFFLSFDMSDELIRRWGGAANLLSELLAAEGSLFPENRTGLADSIEPVLIDLVGVTVPEFGHVAAFLLSYLGVVILSCIIFRFRKRPELAWLVFPVAVPIAILIAYQMGQVRKGETGLSVSEISVTELSPGNGQGKSRGYLGFFSPGGLTTSITFNEATSYGPRVSRAIPERAPFKVIDVQQGQLFTLKDLTLSAGTLQTLSFDNIASLGEGIDTRMMLTKDGLVGQITNRTGQRLDGCLLVYNRYIKPIGSLDNGQTIKVQMADPDCSSWLRDYSWSRIKTRQNVLRERIVSSLFKPTFLGKRVKPGFVFLGWISSPLFDFTATGARVKKDALALLATKVPVVVKEEDEIFVPKGICDVESASRQILLFRGEWKRSHREGDATVDFVLPHVCRKMIAREIKVYSQFRAIDMEVSVELYNWEEKRWVQLEAKRRVTLSEARPYLADGRVRVKVSGRPAGEIAWEAISARFWEVKDLDVEIKGFLGKNGQVPFK